jgi:hypothetical protein
MPRVHNRKLGARTYGKRSEDKLNLCFAAIRSRKFAQRKSAIELNIPGRTITNKLEGKHVYKPG